MIKEVLAIEKWMFCYLKKDQQKNNIWILESHQNSVNMSDMSTLQYIYKTFICSSQVTLPDIKKGLVKVTVP